MCRAARCSAVQCLPWCLSSRCRLCPAALTGKTDSQSALAGNMQQIRTGTECYDARKTHGRAACTRKPGQPTHSPQSPPHPSLTVGGSDEGVPWEQRPRAQQQEADVRCIHARKGRPAIGGSGGGSPSRSARSCAGPRLACWLRKEPTRVYPLPDGGREPSG